MCVANFADVRGLVLPARSGATRAAWQWRRDSAKAAGGLLAVRGFAISTPRVAR